LLTLTSLVRPVLRSFVKECYRIHSTVPDGRDKGSADDHAVGVGSAISADVARVGDAEAHADALGARGVARRPPHLSLPSLTEVRAPVTP
jgi:hypothetical protein